MKIKTKRLPKYNKNENKLHLKENVEKKAQKQEVSSTDDLRDNTMGSKKEAELFKKPPK